MTDFNPSDLSKHVRAKHITALVLGQKPVVSDEDQALLTRHTEILNEKGVDLKSDHEVLVSIYHTLGGALHETSDTTEQAPAPKPKRIRTKKKVAPVTTDTNAASQASTATDQGQNNPATAGVVTPSA